MRHQEPVGSMKKRLVGCVVDVPTLCCAKQFDGRAANAPAVRLASVSDHTAMLRTERERLAVRPNRVACLRIDVQFGAITAFMKQADLKPQQRSLHAATMLDRIETIGQQIKGSRVRIVIREHVLCQISLVQRSPIGVGSNSAGSVDLLKVPLGERGEFPAGARDRHDLTPREHIEPTRETTLRPLGAFGEPAQQAELPAEQQHRL
jgi:hypothetical protein